MSCQGLFFNKRYSFVNWSLTKSLMSECNLDAEIDWQKVISLKCFGTLLFRLM